MNEVRINQAEANRVEEALCRYGSVFPASRGGCMASIAAAEGLVNEIGEIYETAVARTIKESLAAK